MGDYNIKLLNVNNNIMNYTNLFHSYIFFQTITKPNSVTGRSATLIDHIWTNDITNYIRSGIMHINLSDHFPVWSIFSVSTQNNTDHIYITKRMYSNDNIGNFSEALKNNKWDIELMNIKGAENILNSCITKFKNLYDTHFPVKSFPIKKKHFGKPYITPGIMKSIKYRNKLQKLFARWPLTYGTIFRKYRNTLTTVIRTAKANYFKSKLSQVSGDVKKT